MLLELNIKINILEDVNTVTLQLLAFILLRLLLLQREVLLTNIKNFYDNALYACSHGIKRKIIQISFGYMIKKRIGWNFRMSEIQALLVSLSFSRIKSFTDIRIKISKNIKII